ncbi:hypothetical protein SAMN02745977_01486 [Brachymonas denitrificans DSM 15123]|uniref:DUF904 domain-containing protein n=1 Tax=Brachymonas denitrificans DSM 15123 TaxID=1121117 RepID=A0A1H8HC56_9BURK|nr:hypothetical protein SAMN02745977_01486 [Brachymonas denitrificans DSM 15123]
MTTPPTPLSLDQVADRMEHMLLRYQELQKTAALLQGQLQEVTQERDSLKSRLSAARARVDALLARLPAEPAAPVAAAPATAPATCSVWGQPQAAQPSPAAKDDSQ